MAVDWSEAFRIGSIGFGTVFLVLVILSVAITIIGLAVRRANRGKESAQEEK